MASKYSHFLSTVLLLLSSHALALSGVTYKSPQCGCCDDWVSHMKTNGFDLEVIADQNMNQVKQKLGIMPDLASCHTAVINGYVFEGHIPAADIKKFLKEKPEAFGLSVPGMPIGSPGMEYGDKVQAYDVMQLNKTGQPTVFSRHGQ